MADQLAKRRAKKASRPIYFQVRRLVDPATGEEVGALIPHHRIDQRLMRERSYRVGDELRADLKKPRNVKFHRLVHALGGLVVDQIEAFQGLGCHDAIKRLQRETGICCEVQTIELPGIGKLDVSVAQSLAFDEMDEGEFYRLWQGICRHLCDRYWPGLNQDQIETMIDLMPEAV
jgi:hypothetical protein